MINYKIIIQLAYYKVFDKIIAIRITSKPDQYQSKIQVGFRKSYRTTDHFLTKKLLIKKTY